jgi:hypothetical protein
MEDDENTENITTKNIISEILLKLLSHIHLDMRYVMFINEVFLETRKKIFLLYFIGRQFNYFQISFIKSGD